MSRLSVLLALVALVNFAAAKPNNENVHSHGLCDILFCSCDQIVHPSWTSVKCTIPEDTKMDIHELDMPPSVMELTIEGGDSVIFETGALNSVTDIRRIRVSDAKSVLFRQLTAVDINILNLYLDIEKCDVVRFEKNSFLNLRGPMSVNITDCEAVSVEGDTFSWLLNMEISNTHELRLGSGSFSLDPTAANVGDHGPGMAIELKNTTIPEFPRLSFGSSAARIYLENVDVHAIRTGAFSANTYNVVLAINCSINLIEEEAFSEKSLINYLSLDGCKIQQLATKAFRSAIADIYIKKTRFDHVETGAINTTVATVKIMNSEFHMFMEKGFELSSWNKLQMENNSFDELPPNAIAAPAATIHKLVFNNNEIDTMHPESLSFIGKAASREIIYLNNYYGESCNCNISHWLAQALDLDDSSDFGAHSYCTVNEVLARCFHVHDQNMLVKNFIKEVCDESTTIQCVQLKSEGDSEIEIKNIRFPHKYKHEELSARNKKIIGIVIASFLSCISVAILFSLFKWWRRGTGGCGNIKNLCICFKTACTSMCRRLCLCDSNVGIDNARSISQLNINEYSERHRLNIQTDDARPQDVEANFHDEIVETEDKFTQTLPEGLTKELLENLKVRLDNPENYNEAKEMIEHLYELTKRTEEAPQLTSSVSPLNAEENIYELPFQNNTTRRNRGNKQMVSIGVRTPSLDKLMPLSPTRQTVLAHDYFEPLDLTVHLYAEIANNDSGNNNKLGAIPDLVAEQANPRGPYLQAILSSNNSCISSPSKWTGSPMSELSMTPNLSNSSSSSIKMINRPLPKKPRTELSYNGSDEGTSENFTDKLD